MFSIEVAVANNLIRASLVPHDTLHKIVKPVNRRPDETGGVTFGTTRVDNVGSVGV